MNRHRLSFALTWILAAGLLSAAPALAQGKGKAHGRQEHRTEAIRRDTYDRPELHRRDREERWEEDEWEDERWDDRRRDRRAEARRDRTRGRSVPPGWCIGRGNPHNTPENCGPRRNRRDDDRRYENRRRDGDRYEDRNRRAGSYEEAHDRFHRAHEQRCRLRADERPLDPAWQIRVRQECRAEHERWHDRNDPERVTRRSNDRWEGRRRDF